MKNTVKTITLLLFYLAATAFKGNEEQLTIRLYKENKDQSWTEVEGVSFDKKNNPVLQLEYDSYYTIKISGAKNSDSLNNMTIIVNGQQEAKLFSSNFKSIVNNNRKGFENYYTELPYGIASLTKVMTGRQLIYTLQVKTK